MNRNNLYIYLARLDKKGIKVVAAFPHSSNVYPTRIVDLPLLGLSGEILSKVASEQRENKMTHELYAESALSLEQLKKSLSSRGYSHLPVQQFTGRTASTRVNESSLITSESTMIRRASELKR